MRERPYPRPTNHLPRIMTTYTLSETSPKRCDLTDPDGNIVYKLSSPVTLGNSDVTISRGDEVIAIIHWKWFERSTVTMYGKTTTIGEVFPRPKKLSNARIFTMPDGYQFKWQGLDQIYATNVENDINVATYYKNPMYYFNEKKKSTLDIAAGASMELTDALVVTWAIYEKKARDWRRSRYNGGGGGGGGG
ncbi:hypothetical protein RHS04_03917 [Rhizoctonia solani]|uniref:DUF6593 domain-containing protein n=1 Tax=Rhizoctonia solani TaxID=456999 RepID=A0A8H7LNZ8_9AGAM|nr:hypothetical protein RHS04_03917 [Rhizoctonia solani]